MTRYRIGGKAPKISASTFVAPGAHLIGQVELGERASVWFGAVMDSAACYAGRAATHALELTCIDKLPFQPSLA